MPIRQIIEGGRVPVKVIADDVEPHARQQLENVARLPIVVVVHKLKQVVCVKG
jgi:hypothetical protein